MLKFLSIFLTASTGLLAAPGEGPSLASDFHFRDTRSGAVLEGTMVLPRGLTPTVAAHIDVIGDDGDVVTSRPFPVTHPRVAGSRRFRFVIELPAGFVPVKLVLHHGVHP